MAGQNQSLGSSDGGSADASSSSASAPSSRSSSGSASVTSLLGSVRRFRSTRIAVTVRSPRPIRIRGIPELPRSRGFPDATRTYRCDRARMRVRTGTRVGRGLAIGIVAAAVMVLVPAVPAGAKTTVEVKGDVVTITVPIDCVGCKDYVDPINGRKLAKYWEKTAEDAWNAVFNKWPYCSKYKLKLDIKMKNRPAGSASRFGPHELIATQPDGRGFTGAGWSGAPSSSTGAPEGQRVPDGTRYYEFDAQGTMPADATPTVIEHEFGHVIGLGDDRDDAGNPVGPDPKGIMVGGANGVTPNTKLTIGKNHVDRIGDQLANLGKITCGQAWKGTVEQKWQAVSCTSTASSQE